MACLVTHKEWNRGHLRQDRGRQGSRITGEMESEAKVPACHIKREDLIVQVSSKSAFLTLLHGQGSWFLQLRGSLEVKEGDRQ